MAGFATSSELGALFTMLRRLVPEVNWRPRPSGDGLEYRGGEVYVHVCGNIHAPTLGVTFWRGVASEAADLGPQQLRAWLASRLPFIIQPAPTTIKSEHAAAWHRFRETGLLWWLNRSLHLFGWAIVVAYDDTGENVIAAYPERMTYRGFPEDTEEQGFQRLTHYLKREAPHLVRDLEEDSDGA